MDVLRLDQLLQMVQIAKDAIENSDVNNIAVQKLVNYFSTPKAFPCDIELIKDQIERISAQDPNVLTGKDNLAVQELDKVTNYIDSNNNSLEEQLNRLKSECKRKGLKYSIPLDKVPSTGLRNSLTLKSLRDELYSSTTKEMNSLIAKTNWHGKR